MRARTLLRLLLLVQSGAALLVAWALAAFAGWPMAAALAGGLGLALLVRLAINMNNFALAARAASPVPAAFRLGPAGWLRLLAGEFRASMLVSHWHMLRAPRPLRVHADATHVPVLLLHGYGASGGFWAHLVPLLDAARVSHLSIDLVPVTCGIDDYVPLIERGVAQLCAATGSPRVTIVAHSMGGLAARAWMRRHGTALANLGPGLNAVQMRLDSPWLRALEAGEGAAERALITSIWTHHDNIVAPQDSSVLAGARNIAFGGVGHVWLASHPRVLARVLQELGIASDNTTGTTSGTS